MSRQNRATDQMIRHIIALDRLVQKGQRQQLTFGLLGIKNEEMNQMRQFSGNGVLSGVGKSGARVGVSARPKTATFGIVRATGPWQIRDSSVSGGPVKPHIITSKKGGGSRRSRGRRLHFPDGGIGPISGRGSGVGGAINVLGETSKDSEGWRLYARHPGAPRRAYWVNGITKVVPTLGKAIHNRWITKNMEAIYK